VRVEADLTDDLDLVSARLFDLTSYGGSEYVGRVLQVAVNDLSWTPTQDATKLLFVAGNESAFQDPQVDVQEMIELAREREISVHPIFCGRPVHPDAQSWRELAELAEQPFASIDPRADTAVAKTPVDEELAALSSAINGTYIPMGEQGAKRQKSLIRQDQKALELNASLAASRAEAKASPLYSAGWDLVDALEAGKVNLYELEDSQFPESLRQMSFDEREHHVEEIRLKRKDLRRRIAELSEKRERHVARQMKEKGVDGDRSLAAAVRRVLDGRFRETEARDPER
jgi:hypothetical protein